MNKRIQKLRAQSTGTMASLSAERALLVTRFYQSQQARGVSAPLQRALCFAYLLKNKSLYIGEGELIVGERGPAPKATSTYPEICLHSMKDLDILATREKVPFSVDADTRALYENEIIPFWKGRTIRERIFNSVSPQWKAAYEAGMFTEFQEQRAPGHTVLGDKIYRLGFTDLTAEIREAIQNLDFFTDPLAYSKNQELLAMEIAAKAMMDFAGRYAQNLLSLAKEEADPDRKAELEQMARNCENVPARSPRTFWEALQYYWFVHLGVITELNPWDAFNPGRLDQHLYPFYKKETQAGTLTKERAKELLQAFWIKFNNHPSPPKVGVTAQESNTYVDFATINLGGVTPDGADGVNELTYLILDVIQEMRLLQPSSMVQLSKKNPDPFIHRALEIIRTGFGQPSVFNTEAIIQELMRQGKSAQDARKGGASGCVETGAFGHEAYILTGYFNLPKVLEITLNNGKDPGTGEQIGIETGDPREFDSFDRLLDAFKAQLRHFIDIKIQGNNTIERIYAECLPAPFLSLLIDDCIENGKDYNDGGARYNTSYIQGVGLGSVTDGLTSLKVNVFDEKRISMDRLLEAMAADFDGHEDLRQVLVDQTPKYGNDEDIPDGVLKAVFEAYYEAVDSRPNTRGGMHRINLLPTTSHVYFGGLTGALPDGRKAGVPLSEGISPVQGADRKGPTAVIKSAAKIDHIRTGGTLLNQKFLPQMLATPEDRAKLAQMIRSYFRMDGHHIQFNVVDAKTLREAQQHPEEHRDLIVRVAGYSDYFVDLGADLQDEIIKRTAHGEF